MNMDLHLDIHMDNINKIQILHFLLLIIQTGQN